MSLPVFDFIFATLSLLEKKFQYPQARFAVWSSFLPWRFVLSGSMGFFSREALMTLLLGFFLSLISAFSFSICIFFFGFNAVLHFLVLFIFSSSSLVSSTFELLQISTKVCRWFLYRPDKKKIIHDICCMSSPFNYFVTFFQCSNCPRYEHINLHTCQFKSQWNNLIATGLNKNFN